MESKKNLKEHKSGAVREAKEGMGRFDCLPWPAIQRLAKQYEGGAEVHGAWNWRKGIPQTSYLSSALRHLMKYSEGWEDEDHLAAVMFNICGLITLEHDVSRGTVPAELLDHPKHDLNNNPGA